MHDFHAQLNQSLESTYHELYSDSLANLVVRLESDKDFLAKYLLTNFNFELPTTIDASSTVLQASHILDAVVAAGYLQAVPVTEMDLQFEILYFNDPKLKGVSYAMVFTSQTKYLDIVKAMPGVSDFGFSAQVDCIPGVSAADWRARGRVWDNFLEYSAPGDVASLAPTPLVPKLGHAENLITKLSRVGEMLAEQRAVFRMYATPDLG